MGLTLARIKNLTEPDQSQPDGVPVLFNPDTYTIARNQKYQEVYVPGLQKPLLQFVRGEAELLTVTLFLDSRERRTPAQRGLDEDLERLRALTRIVSATHAPPIIEFIWGDTNFQGVVYEFLEKYALFDENGHVTRARVDLKIKSFTPAHIQLSEVTRESPDRTKTRVVREGERLDLIAAEEYGDVSLWSVIADHNDITRPRFLAAGTVLVIPPL